MSIKKANIGNALNSVAPDHVVATSDAIFDESLNRYQDSINAEILSKGGLYECDTAAGTGAKVVSATGYVLSAGGGVKVKMVYANIATSFVTLNIGSTGAKSLYYNGRPVSASNTWLAGDTLEVYYDGTYYQATNIIGVSSYGAYDISANNLTLGNPTKYASLSDAISAIPGGIKKPGLEIKYIDSTSNNYLFYKFLSSDIVENFTDTTCWDNYNATDTIESGSRNFVTSDAINSELTNLGHDINFYATNISATEINTETIQTSYSIGDIFYVDEGSEGENYSTYVNGYRYFVAKVNGSAGDDYTNSSLFANTFSATEAVRLSEQFKAPAQVKVTAQNFTEPQKLQARTNIGVPTIVAMSESDYENLVTVDPETYYMIYEDED